MNTPPKYISNTHLAARVGSLNPRWNDDSSSERMDAQFLKAVQLTGTEFEEAVDYISKVGRLHCVSMRFCFLYGAHLIPDGRATCYAIGA